MTENRPPPPPSAEELDREISALLESQARREADPQTLLATWRHAYAFLLATWMHAHGMDPPERQAFLRQEGQEMVASVGACLQSLTAPPHDHDEA
jgi:hypothetical protein